MKVVNILTNLALLWLIPQVQCLHLYLKPNEVKCFYENLEKGELLAATFDLLVEAGDEYARDDNLLMSVTVDESFDNDHRVVSQHNVPPGPFSFSALDKGEHRICIKPTFPKNDIKIKTSIEIHMGKALSLESRRTSSLNIQKDRLRVLNERLLAIRAEQEEIKLA